MNRLSHGFRTHLRDHAYGVLAVLIALGGTAYAATSFVSAGGTVRGCVSKKGQLTVLKKSAKKCGKGLTLITWNQKGPAGQTGAQGPQGGQGVKGDQGLKGDQGDSGLATGPASGDLTGSYPDPSIAAGAVTAAKVAGANKDGLANVPSLRTLGTGASQAMPGNATPGGPPTGSAGGALAGTYPNPTLNVTGGPCATGKFVTDLSNLSALTCGPVGENTALGSNALAAGAFSPLAGNTAVGKNALTIDTTGLRNSAFGHSALNANSSGTDNAAVGQNALSSNTSGGDNSALGQGALDANTTGPSNSAVGKDALGSNTTGGGNSAVGGSALQNSNGDNNSALGDSALVANTTGDNNSAVGEGALSDNTMGSDNSAVGLQALSSNTAGNGNTAVGETALSVNIAGDNNSAVGLQALRHNTGADNSALGKGALDANTTGGSNVAVGANALDANTSGSGNSVFGTGALGSKTGGANNVAIGKDAGDSLVSGTDNALFGTNAGGNLTTNDSSNVDIANFGGGGDNHRIRIGTQGAGAGQQNQTFIAGISGVTVTGGAGVFIDSNGQLGTISSSRRFKTRIRTLAPLAGKVMRLRPVSFLYKRRYAPHAGRQYGLIAEEVAKVFPSLVVKGHDGKPYTVAYQQLPVLLLAQLQREHKRNARQQRRIDRLEAQVRKLARRR